MWLATMSGVSKVWKTSAMSRPSVLIVDDHESFRRSASLVLEAEGFEVAGTAADGDAAISAVRVLAPDLVLLDIQLPGLDGFAVAERLAQLPVAPCVVLTSSRTAASFGRLVESAPVSGFLPKHELSGDTLAAFLD